MIFNCYRKKLMNCPQIVFLFLFFLFIAILRRAVSYSLASICNSSIRIRTNSILILFISNTPLGVNQTYCKGMVRSILVIQLPPKYIVGDSILFLPNDSFFCFSTICIIIFAIPPLVFLYSDTFESYSSFIER